MECNRVWEGVLRFDICDLSCLGGEEELGFKEWGFIKRERFGNLGM